MAASFPMTRCRVTSGPSLSRPVSRRGLGPLPRGGSSGVLRPAQRLPRPAAAEAAAEAGGARRAGPAALGSVRELTPEAGRGGRARGEAISPGSSSLGGAGLGGGGPVPRHGRRRRTGALRWWRACSGADRRDRGSGGGWRLQLFVGEAVSSLTRGAAEGGAFRAAGGSEPPLCTCVALCAPGGPAGREEARGASSARGH